MPNPQFSEKKLGIPSSFFNLEKFEKNNVFSLKIRKNFTSKKFFFTQEILLQKKFFYSRNFTSKKIFYLKKIFQQGFS